MSRSEKSVKGPLFCIITSCFFTFPTGLPFTRILRKVRDLMPPLIRYERQKTLSGLPWYTVDTEHETTKSRNPWHRACWSVSKGAWSFKFQNNRGCSTKNTGHRDNTSWREDNPLGNPFSMINVREDSKFRGQAHPHTRGRISLREGKR